MEHHSSLRRRHEHGLLPVANWGRPMARDQLAGLSRGCALAAVCPGAGGKICHNFRKIVYVFYLRSAYLQDYITSLDTGFLGRAAGSDIGYKCARIIGEAQALLNFG